MSSFQRFGRAQARRLPVARRRPVGHSSVPHTSRLVISPTFMSKRRERRVAPQVALALLECLRAADRPDEYLEDEVPSATLPRRLGLSDVIGKEIRKYEEEARRGRRVAEADVGGLIGLVIRRGDSDEVFRRVGQRLAAGSKRRGVFAAVAPQSLRLALARRASSKRIGALFGERFAEFEKDNFAFTGSDVPFINVDPGAVVCEIVSGLCEETLREYTGTEARLSYSLVDADRAVVRWSLGAGQPSPASLAGDAPGVH